MRQMLGRNDLLQFVGDMSPALYHPDLGCGTPGDGKPIEYGGVVSAATDNDLP